MVNFVLKLLFKLAGWKIAPGVPPEAYRNCVMIAVPHTSNWDFVYALATFAFLKIPVRYTIKKEFNLPVLGWLLRSVGAIWVDRSPRKPGEERRSMVEAMADLFEGREDLVVLITPEGTRSKVTEWKTGFYSLAKQLDLPIALGFLDYEKKIAGVGGVVVPTDDMAADMHKIMAFYQHIPPKFPEKFSPDLRYV
jgi:1-acyl-sn-glycerol-3-phosphate acyltransferase